MTNGRLVYVTQVAPYTHGPAGVHGVLGQSAVAVTQIAEIHGLDCQVVPDVRLLHEDELAATQVVALFTIGETPWSDRQRRILLDNVRAGRTHVLAIHSATDSCYGWPEYGLLVGARFAGHPWTRDVTLDVCDADHPALRHLDETWDWHDEVYTFRDLRPDARVLLRISPSQADMAALPLSWCFAEGRGRTFSTSLGHFPAAWESVDFLRHLSGGVTWLLDG